MKNRLFTTLLVAVLVLALGLTGCTAKPAAATTAPTGAAATPAPTEVVDVPEHDTLVLGYDEFNGVFSPFFGTTGYDMDVTNMVHAVLINNDRLGAPVDGLAIYKVPEEVKAADGSVEKTIYTFQLREGLKFSDGTPVTADDVIFSYKVLLDPMYDGPSMLASTAIVGAAEYRYDDVNYKTKSDEIAAQADVYEPTEAEIAEAAQRWADDNGMTKEDFMPGNANYDDYILPELRDLQKGKLEAAYIQENLAGGIDVQDIEGIKKIDERTVQVTLMGVDPNAIWLLGGISVAPAAYYGADFSKGKLDGVKAVNGTPMGAGAYKFISFENNVISMEANANYYLGQPKVPKIKFQVVDTSNKLESVKLGDTDISDPPCNPEMIEEVEAAGLHYEAIDNLGYGYIGINSERISDKNVRKGLMSLMNRAPAVRDYYGDTASVIERPMSMVSWAYPTGAQPFYTYSKEKALEFFTAAGYTQSDKDGKKFLANKAGEQLTVEVGIPGDGTGDHPSFKVLSQMKSDLEELGGVLNIRDVDGAVFFEQLDADGWDMWCAAWGATIDPDMYQVYHSSQTQPGMSNHYKIKDETLDKLMVEARSTNDVEVRKQLYSQCLDIIMDWAVEMPVYQRKNMYIFNPEIINIETLPKEMTPFYGYFREIETLELQ